MIDRVSNPTNGGLGRPAKPSQWRRRLALFCASLFALLSIALFTGFLLKVLEIRSYRHPFMTMDADLSRPGVYEGILNKRFDPQLAIALCLVPSVPREETPNMVEGLRGELSLTSAVGSNVYVSPLAFSRSHVLPSGDRVYCQYIGAQSFPVGEYRFHLRIDTEAAALRSVEHSIAAYPVADFQSIIAFFCLAISVLFLFLGLLCCAMGRVVSRGRRVGRGSPGRSGEVGSGLQ